MEQSEYLIIGSAGQLAWEFRKELNSRGLSFAAPDEDELDITNYDNVRDVAASVCPRVIVNCAAYNAVDDAEDNEQRAFEINSLAVGNLASLCKENNITLVHYSSDYVFDGTKKGLYTEDDIPNPLNVYGKSKLKGEELVRESGCSHLVFRLSWVIGAGQQNFLYKLSTWAEKNPVLSISSDEASVPTFTEDIVSATLLALEKGLSGLYHLTNSGYASRYELSRAFLKTMDLDNIVIPVAMSSFETKAERPGFSPMSNAVLSEQLGISIPSWEDALGRYVEDRFEGKG
ncbi:MAG: dTDP-4-dehydrorhamnose reductase [bacterium]|nr:dTDP-4-dehydrorhamnose reductase [bacterium]